MTKTGLLLTLVFVFLVERCAIFVTPTLDQPSPIPATVTPTIPTPVVPTPLPDIPGISPKHVRNAEYQLGLLDQIQVVQLIDGQYQESSSGNESHISVTVTDFIVRGDLTGDGKDEAAAIISENYGGSGSFVFLAVFQYLNGKAVFLTSIFLDDRPLIIDLAIEGREIYIDAVIHDRDDPSCCPTLETTRRYLLNGINLILTNYGTKTPTGDSRMINIEAPVDNAQVSGIMRLKGNITISPFENNLIYRIYDLGGLELSVGPINVDAPIMGGPGTFEKAVDLGNILANTSIRVSVEDRNVADGTLFAMDSVILQIR